jgi:hypothetical protein
MKKKCPKCGGVMVDDCCVRCGYMTNGNVAGSYVANDKFEELRIYDKHFDEMYRNENVLMTFLLGPLNFSYRNQPFLGGTITVAHILLFLEVSALLNPVSRIDYFIYMVLHVLYLLIIRVAYCAFVNRIILGIDKIKINMLKKGAKDQDDFYDSLDKHNDKSIGAVILSVLISICIILLLLIVYVKR